MIRQIFVFLLLFCAWSCEGTPRTISLKDEKRVHEALIGSWEAANYEEVYSHQKEVPIEMVTMSIYAANGSFQTKNQDGTISTSGKWKYNPITCQVIKTFPEGTYGQRIVLLTKKELLMTRYSSSNKQALDSSIEIYRKL